MIRTIAVATSSTPPNQSILPVEPAVGGGGAWRSMGRQATMASTPRGRKLMKIKRQLSSCRKSPKRASPVSVPNLAPMMGTAKARPRSSGPNVAASMALELPRIMADPNPATPRHITTCHRSCDSAIRPDPIVDARMPRKNTRACP